MKRFCSVLAVFLAMVLFFGLLPAQEVSAAPTKNGYMSLQDAASYVRKEFAAFNTDVKIKFYFESDEAYTDRELWELLKAEVMKHTGVGDEGDYMNWSFQTVSYDAQDTFDGKTHYVDFEYIVPIYNNTAAQEKELEQKLDQVMASLNLTGKSDYEKIKSIYEYVCKNVVYSDEVLNSGASPVMPPDHLRIYYSAYGALVLGQTTCQGFSSLIYRMMLEAGVDCRLIAGDIHAWNIVKLDGKYYYLDPTWDSDSWHARGEFDYFLKGSDSFRVGGRKTNGGFFSYQHKTYAVQFNEEFLNRYPISTIGYAEEDLSAGAADTVIGSGQCGNAANWTLTAGGKLTISGAGAIWDAPDGVFWFESEVSPKRWDGLNGYIKQVEIQEGITAIGMYAFANCPQLTDIMIPSSLQAIGAYAFALCEKLPSITLPNTVKTVDSNAFYQCVRMKNATISAGMQEVPEGAFTGCTGLKTVTIPNGVKKIGEAAFATCPKLQSVQIPASVTSLGPMAFAQSFDPDMGLSFTVPATVTEVGFQCFAESGLYDIRFLANVKNVDNWMFNYCRELRSVTLSDAIKTFSENTFYDCTNLKSVILPSGLTDLGIWPFVGCQSLKTIVWPSSLIKIPELAFSGCVALEEVILPDSLTTIESGAFSACTGLKRITIPASVKKLGDMLFGSCSALETVKFEGDAPQVGENPFALAGEITVYYPKNNNTWNQNVMNKLMLGHPFVSFVATHGPNDPHTPGAWSKDANNHWQNCTDCGEVMQSQAHSWDAGNVTKQPNCKEEGIKTYTCTVCDGTKTESIPKTETHSYTYACSEQCNICGVAREVTHQYGTEWTGGAQTHWHACTVCGGKQDETAHIPGPAATEENAQLCTVCGWIICPNLNHMHDENMEMKHDDESHWYVCSGCNELIGLAEHSWQNPCDKSCEECGFTRSTEHQFAEAWEGDKDSHWHMCSSCGEQADMSAHIWEDDHCTVCGTQKEQSTAQTNPQGTESKPAEPSDTEKSGKMSLWILIGVAVIIAGAVITVVLVKKKRG